MKRLLATVGSGVIGLGLALTTAAPAQANDRTLRIRNGNGTVVAKAWYNDKTDNLCVRSYVRGKMATVKIGPAQGGPRASVNDAGYAKPSHCTGNMSIPEDRPFWMHLTYQRQGKDGGFYT